MTHDPMASLRCLNAMTDYALANGPDSLAKLDPDAIAVKHGACPFLIRLVIGMICPANAECSADIPNSPAGAA